jgi:surface antigen
MMITWGSAALGMVRPVAGKAARHKPRRRGADRRLREINHSAADFEAMKGWTRLGAVVLALAISAPAAAAPAVGIEPGLGYQSAGELPYLQCVPYARQVSGIAIYGDAWTWWDQAASRYERGYRPRAGAVMAFKPHGNMRLGHVAAVSLVIDTRTVLLRHANWSPINGRRGQIEDDVRAVDVSPENNWSEVRVWYDPIQAIGGTAWPVAGFIYNRPAKTPDERIHLTQNSRQPVRAFAATKLDRPAISVDPIGNIIAARTNRSLAARSEYRRLD